MLVLVLVAECACSVAAQDVAVCLLKDPAVSVRSAQQTDLGSLALQEKPLLSPDDFLYYEWPAGRMGVSPEAFQRIPEPGVQGTPFVIAAGGKPQYLGALWSLESSVPAAPPLVVWTADLRGSSLKIGQGYPEPVSLQADPRDLAVREAFQKVGKLRMSFDSYAKPDPAEARRLFIEVRKLDLLPDQQAESQVAHLYKDILTQVMGPPRLANPMFWPGRTDPRKPEEMADGAYPEWLRHMAMIGSFRVLNRHQETLKPLVASDIRSSDDLSIYRALQTIAECSLVDKGSDFAQNGQKGVSSGWRDFYPAVARVLSRNQRLVLEAANTLVCMDDPRAIRLLAKAMSHIPALCDQVRVLQRGRAAEPLLLKMLASRSSETRQRAAYALAESGDSALAPWVIRLSRDSDGRMRLAACEMGFAMDKDGFAEVRASLLPLLEDQDAQVRERAICLFARRVDRASAAAALAWLRDESLESFNRSCAVGAMEDLSGRTFGYDHGEPHKAPVNKAAVEQFADWVESHKP